MSFEDGLRVVKRRGESMQAAADATPSGMVSILLLEKSQVEQIVAEASAHGILQIANFLCPGNLVVSGEIAACERAAELAIAAGGRAIPLAVAGAFHTRIMHPADEAVAEVLATVELRSPEIPVISNVDGRIHSDPEEIRDLLVRQVISPVRWEDSVNLMLSEGCDEFYEVGPGKVLKGLLKRISRKSSCTTVNDSFDETGGV
jgi:[acyl-carrier-protein] S-malonyltransferase